MLKGFPSESPGQLTPINSHNAVHQHVVDPFRPPVGVAVGSTAGHRPRVEDHQVSPEALPDEAPVLEADEIRG